MNHKEDIKNCKFDELEVQLRAIAAADQVPIAKLGLYATAMMKHLIKYEQPFQELLDRGIVCAGFGLDDQRYSKVVELFAATLEEARHTGTIRAVDTHRVGRMFADAIMNLMMHRLGSTTKDGVENDVRVLMDLYLNGLAISY